MQLSERSFQSISNVRTLSKSALTIQSALIVVNVIMAVRGVQIWQLVTRVGVEEWIRNIQMSPLPAAVRVVSSMYYIERSTQYVVCTMSNISVDHSQDHFLLTTDYYSDSLPKRISRPAGAEVPTYYLLLTTHYSLLTACYSLHELTIHYSLFTTHCSRLTSALPRRSTCIFAYARSHATLHATVPVSNAGQLD